MTAATLPLVVLLGERAVCHLVDPDTPAAELPGLLALYLGVSASSLHALARRDGDVLHPLDPALPVGAQLAADAEVELHPV